MKGIEVSLVGSVTETVSYQTKLTADPADLDMFVPFDGRLSPEELRRLPQQGIGIVAYELVTPRVLSCEMFYPFNFDGSKKPIPQLVGKGLASQIQLIVAENLLHHFPEDIEVVHLKPSPSRERQLRSLGIEPEDYHPLEEYVSIIRDGIEEISLVA